MLPLGAQRPAVPAVPAAPAVQFMHEVTLGPLLGKGAHGRCYRGRYRGSRVAVKASWGGGSTSRVQAQVKLTHRLNKIFDVRGCSRACKGQSVRLPVGYCPYALTLTNVQVLECSMGADAQERAASAAILEAALSHSLKHPNIVDTLDWGTVSCEVWGPLPTRWSFPRPSCISRSTSPVLLNGFVDVECLRRSAISCTACLLLACRLAGIVLKAGVAHSLMQQVCFLASAPSSS